MELPIDVLIHNELLGMKGTAGRLLAINRDGYYEISAAFGDREHRVLLPIAATVLISAAEEEVWEGGLEVER